MEKFIQKYVNLFDKKNRICSRKDYWIFVLFNNCVFLFFTALAWFIDTTCKYGANWDFYIFFTGFVMFLLSWLTIILGIKRLRDVGISPCFMLLSIIPYINIILIILFCLPTNTIKSKIPTTYIGK